MKKAHAGSGGDCANGAHWAAVYRELRTLARFAMSSTRSCDTLQATELVHEAFLRIARRQGDGFVVHDAQHLRNLALRAMRQCVVNRGVRKATPRHGGGRRRLPAECLDQVGCHSPARVDHVVDALDALEAVDPIKSRIVQLRVLGGCTVDETAEVLKLSAPTVKRHWRMARAWLKTALQQA